jgi:hypothetical protein
MSRYKWVYWNDGTETKRLFQVGILDDGTLYNPNGYPEDLVRASVLAADVRCYERRSSAAKKAAGTRKQRRDRNVYRIVSQLLANRTIGPRRHCACCGRQLDDWTSIQRGIGTECWQDILHTIEECKSASFAA